MSRATTIGDTRAELWRARLGWALRTTLACTIVGCTALHGPEQLRQYIKFPAFSYVTTILVVSDANLGDTIRGCWHVFSATLQVMILSIVGLQVVGPAHFTSRVAATAVAASAFMVAVPEKTHLLTKRIAFGQLVIVYVGTVIFGAEGGGVLKHPIQVASSTALGALASVLAMLFPYPRLSHFQVKKAIGLYAENASERFNHNLEAVSASDNSTGHDLCTQSKSLANAGAKLLHWIKSNLDGMRWERPRMRDFFDKLQDKEISLRGMEIALSSCTSFPVGSIDEELRSVLLDYRGRFSFKFSKQASCVASFDASTAPESKNKDNFNSFPWSLKNLSVAHKPLPISFFLYCVQLLLEETPIATNTNNMEERTQKTDAHEHGILKRIKEVIINMLPSRQNLAFAFKCSVSLGLAVFFGLTYDREHALWSGLTIAISFATRRQPTFSVANARGQGTAMGSIYGVICSFLFHRFGGFSFLPLLPWVVFCCFLMHSKMYGQAGGISAVIGALLILGRKNYGPPAEFAIARIAEATIGLTCFIAVEIILNPSRGKSLAKSQLSHGLTAFKDCIETIAIASSDKQKTSWNNSQELRKRQEDLKSIVCQLQEFIEEAELEPNFWFLPFRGACYRKILDSLSTMTDLLLFVAHSIENVSRLSQREGETAVQLQDRVNEDIELFKAKVGPTLKCLEEITQIKSLRKLERKWKKRNPSRDIELGEHPNADTIRVLRGHEEAESIACSFLQHLEEMTDALHSNSSNEEAVIGQLIAHYSCLGFCISGLIRETIKIENEIKELVMWENPSSDSSLTEIYYKINALRS